MVTDFASFWIDSLWGCGGRWVEEKVTKCDQILGIQKQDFVKCLKINNLQSFVVSCTNIKSLVVIVNYSVFIVGYIRY